LALLRPVLAVSTVLELPLEPPDDAILYAASLPNVLGHEKVASGAFANICTGTLVGCIIGVGGIEVLLGLVPETVIPDGIKIPGTISSFGSSSSVRSTMLSRQSLRILAATPEHVKFGSSAQGLSSQDDEVEREAIDELTLATEWCLDQRNASIWT
jgi:hypothetical protein